MHLPWVEKYRPNNIEDLVLDEYVLRKLLSFTHEVMPHILCSGQPGVGKTSAALAIAKHLCGTDYVELNASDNRGINMITDLVSSFCRSSACDPKQSIKIIILDEADNITKKAQQQLINFIENYPKIRIIFTCNDFDQIIEPLQSRCMLMTFSKPTLEQSKKVIVKILEGESVKWEHKAIETLMINVDWDLRAAINALQAIYVSYGDINEENVLRFFSTPSIKEVFSLVDFVGKPEESVVELMTLLNKGLNAIDMITALISEFQSETSPAHIPRERLMFILEEAHITYYRMLQTVESVNQMIRFLYKINDL